MSRDGQCNTFDTLPVNFRVSVLKLIRRRVTLDYEIITPYSDNAEKWHFKMEWCRKAGFSPYNDLYWELAERAYAHRYSVFPLPNKIKENT